MAEKKSIHGVLLKIFFAVFIFFLQIATSNILHSPLNKINLIVLSAMLLLFFSSYKTFFPYLIGLSLISELFRVTPFGIITLSILIAQVSLEWMLNTILTNRFFLTVFLSGVIGIVVYRTVFVILLYFWRIIAGTTFEISAATLHGYGLEIGVNAIALTIIYLVALPFATKMNPRYVFSDNNYGR